jgi:small subunit ribosomal protein S17
MSETSQAAAPPGAADAAKENVVVHSRRRSMVGKVVRDKMTKTVTVEVVTSRRDPLYGKYVRSRSRFKAHDERNEFKVGDQVEIQEHRPISRDKRFIVTRLIKKFVEE